MNTQSQSSWFPFLFVFFFPVMWCFVGWMLSRLSGWQRLARLYPAHVSPIGRRFSTYGRMGQVQYKGCLYVRLTPEGMFLSTMLPFHFVHKTILILARAVTD